jgi:hypothetical protein
MKRRKDNELPGIDQIPANLIQASSCSHCVPRFTYLLSAFGKYTKTATAVGNFQLSHLLIRRQNKKDSSKYAETPPSSTHKIVSSILLSMLILNEEKIRRGGGGGGSTRLNFD